MTMNGTTAAPTGSMRRLTGDAVATLVGLVEVFEDLQTVLRCCERLVTELAVDGEPDPVVVEAVWTTALLSYARCFAAGGDQVALTESDLTSTQSSPQAVEWHRLLLQLRDHYADPAVNPRERFSVGVAQNGQGRASGIAITSARQPLVDDLTVRQTGAIGYALSGLVNERIELRQKAVFDNVASWSRVALDKLAPLDVVAPQSDDAAANS
jgi:hypothetical protein